MVRISREDRFGLIDPITLVASAYKRKNYSFFESGQYNLNLFGIRNKTRAVDAWDDVLGCIYKSSFGPQMNLWAGTTDPGLKYIARPSNAKGVAILKPGQYPGLWEVGLHKGKTPAFVQRGKVVVYRDNNRDNKLDLAVDEEAGWFGINGHQAYKKNLELVGPASAGCQVWHSHKDMAQALDLARWQTSNGLGSTFSYTLFDAYDDESLQAIIDIFHGNKTRDSIF